MVSVHRLAFLSPFYRPPPAYSFQTIALLKYPRVAHATIFTSAALASAISTPQKQTSSGTSTLTYPNMSSSTGSNDGVASLTGFLEAEKAAALDAELMSSPGFSLEQLMELAGLSVAEAVYATFPPRIALPGESKTRVVLVCGPGNNGGDGLVAARHLFHFGYDCVVVYPKRSTKQHFLNLVKQCEDVQIHITEALPEGWEQQCDVLVDALFGFSFKGEPREPFASILQDVARQNIVPVVSVDVPSGWDVDEGDVAGTGFSPDVLVSLTSPKLSALKFTGRHFVGGRFLPPYLADKYGIKMPPYPGVSQVMEISRRGDEIQGQGDHDDWARRYAEYCAERETRIKEAGSEQDVFSTQTAKASSDAEATDDWGSEYEKFLAEKDQYDKILSVADIPEEK